MTVSIMTVRALISELRRRGAECADLLPRIALQETSLHDAQLRVDLRSFDTLAQSAYERSGAPTLGLDAGLRAPISALGVLGPLLLTERSLRDALQAVRKYMPLLGSETTWELVEQRDAAVIVYSPPGTYDSGTRFATEYCFAMATRIGAILAGSDGALRREVRFRHRAPPDKGPYERAFQCPVRFECGDNAIVLPRARLDNRQLHTDDQVQRVLERTAEQQLALLASATFVQRVRSLLLERADLRDVDMATVAHHFGLTPRTLRRRLEVDGASLSELLAQVRAERAKDELAMPGAVIKEVAHRLGYESPSSFHRAFRRWNAISPAEYISRRRETTQSSSRDAAGH